MTTAHWPKCPVCGEGVSPVEQVVGGTGKPVHTNCIIEYIEYIKYTEPEEES
jgi:hypothetical protein